MAKEQSKPSFEVVKGKEVTTMNVRDFDGSNLIFNAERVGPANYFQLRDAKFGPEGAGFRAPTFGELAPLIYSALKNIDIEEAKEVAQTLRIYRMAGKTLALTGKEEFLVDDNPDLELARGNLGDYKTSLKDRLGRRQEGNIIYSDDGLVRFVPRGFLQGTQSLSDFVNDERHIAIVGNPERAEMLGKASKFYRLSLRLGKGFDETDSPELRVPSVGDSDYFGKVRLFVDGYDPLYVDRESFGVKKSS